MLNIIRHREMPIKIVETPVYLLKGLRVKDGPSGVLGRMQSSGKSHEAGGIVKGTNAPRNSLLVSSIKHAPTR